MASRPQDPARLRKPAMALLMVVSLMGGGAGLAQQPEKQVLAVDEALQRLGQEEPHVAAVVRLRWFADLSVEQAVAAPDFYVRTANRHWAYARVWLYQEPKPDCDG